jgi:hypothetical protein
MLQKHNFEKVLTFLSVLHLDETKVNVPNTIATDLKYLL